jgi:hypothetical protein
MSNDGGNTNMTLAEWRTAVGMDNNSIVSTPNLLFADVSADNYQLSPTSPAIDMGSATWSGATVPALDMAKTQRIWGAHPDAGAFEYPLATSLQEVTRDSQSWADVDLDARVTLYDINGREVVTATKGKILGNADQFLAGLYIFQLRTENHPMKSGLVSIVK